MLWGEAKPAEGLQQAGDAASKLTFNVQISWLTTGQNYRGPLWWDQRKLLELGKQAGHLALCVLGGLGMLRSAFPGKGLSSLSFQMRCSD